MDGECVKEVPSPQATTSAEATYGYTPPAQRRRADFTQDVVVLVGKSETRFVVHKNILCGSSEFLKAAVKGPWKEGEEGKIYLSSVEVSAFEVYIAWLYTAKLDLWDGGQNKTFGLSRGSRIVSVYVLGDFLGDRLFTNALMDEMLAICQAPTYLPKASTVKNAYENLPRNCGLCRLIVDLYICSASTAQFETRASVLPADFIMDIAKAAIKERTIAFKDKRPERRGKCHYHEHKDDADKCA